ncbi:MAG: VCBS repeat-containing protein, partial [Planctomycetota bacterium]
IDGDGRPEVLVETQSELVVVSLQGGDLVAVASLPVAAAVDFEFGDVNQDGLLDVLAATGGQLLQFPATGPGTFGGPQVAAPLQGNVVFELNDLDADGDLEVVLADDTRIGVLEPMPGGAPYGVVFTTNHGLSAASSLAFGEFTGDAQLDVVQRFGDDFRVWRGLGDGTLATEGDFTMAGGTTDLLVLDVDLDGLDDVLVADSGEVFADPVDGALIARLGLPGGGLGQPIPYGDTLNSSRLALGDLDQDGVEEVLVAESTSPGVTLIRRDGAGGLAATPTTFLSLDIDGLPTGDMNQDGLDDVVASGILFSSPRFGVFTSDGNGDVTQATTVALASLPSDVALADLTGNGELDVVVSFEGLARIEVREGNGDATVGAAQSYATQTGIEDLTLVDLNGDGRSDVVAVADSTSDVSVLLAQADGTLGPETRFPAGSGASRVAAGDFDNDGNQDLVVVQGSGPGDVVALVLAGDGAGNFVQSSQLSSPNLVAIDVETGDVDGDGIDDVGVLCDAALVVFLGDGQGEFGPALAFEGVASTVNGDLELADVTGDGRADALHSSTAEDALVYYEARSEGALFESRQLFRASLLSREVALGDLDGDEDLEALVGDPFTRFLFVFRQL